MSSAKIKIMFGLSVVACFPPLHEAANAAVEQIPNKEKNVVGFIVV